MSSYIDLHYFLYYRYVRLLGLFYLVPFLCYANQTTKSNLPRNYYQIRRTRFRKQKTNFLPPRFFFTNDKTRCTYFKSWCQVVAKGQAYLNKSILQPKAPVYFKYVWLLLPPGIKGLRNSLRKWRLAVGSSIHKAVSLIQDVFQDFDQKFITLK